MASCLCGASVRWVLTEAGEKVLIDSNESYIGPDRYVVTDYESTPWKVQLVDPRMPVAAHADHRPLCPQRAA